MQEETLCPVCAGMECSLVLSKLDAAGRDVCGPLETLTGLTPREQGALDSLRRLLASAQVGPTSTSSGADAAIIRCMRLSCAKPFSVCVRRLAGCFACLGPR